MIKLLIVDDEEKTREGLKKFIPWNTIGVEIIGLAEDGQQALAILEKNPADIILTDVRMPKMDGIELAKRTREILPDCEIIFISGYSEKAYLKSAIQLQAVDYIEKPIDTSEVITVFKKTVQIVNDKIEKKKNQTLVMNALSKSKHITKEKIAFELLRKKSDFFELKESFELLLGSFPKDMDYITVIFTLKNNALEPSGNEILIKERILGIIEKEFDENKYKCLAVFKSENQILAHIFRNYISDNQSINSILYEIRSIYNNRVSQGNGGISIAVGQKVSGLENVYLSYQTAVIAAQKLFFSRDNLVYFVDRHPRIFDFNDLAISEITQKIDEAEYENAATRLRKLVMDIRGFDDTIVNRVKDYFVTLFIQINKLMQNDLSDIGKEDSLRTILEAESIGQIEESIIDRIQYVADSRNSKNDKSKLTNEIIDFINKNYTDADITINTIAQHMLLTPNYLSLLFKKETGKTINNYLTEVRVEKAKAHLRNRKIKLYEISEMVGYSDANYFTKIFKKIVGLTPSEYRERN